MSIDIQRLRQLAETERLDLDLLRRKALDVSKDKNGSVSNLLAGTLRFLAVSEYTLNKEVALFREQLSEAANIARQLIDRFDRGEPISPSFVSMMAYKDLFNALAAGDKALAVNLAVNMGGRIAIEREYDRPFDLALGYSLKSLLVSDSIAVSNHLESLELACKESANMDFKGYAKVLRAIVSQDEVSVREGFAEILNGHKRQCKGKGLFKDTVDEVLCVWGLGMANLARMCGLELDKMPDDSLIPSELIILNG